MNVYIRLHFVLQKDPSVDAFKFAAIPILKKFMFIPDDIELNINKRGVQPEGGGEIYFNCPNIKKLKPVQVLHISPF